MKKIIPFLKPYRAQLLLAVLLSAASTLCELLLPTIMSDILDKGVYLADLSYILRCCGRMLIVALISLGTVLGGAYLSAQVVAGFCTDLRETVFNRVNNMSFEEFNSIGTSALLSRATHDIGNLSWVASMLSGSVVTIPVLFLGGVLLAMRKDVVLSLVLLAFVPLLTLIVVLLGKRVLPLWGKSDDYIDMQNALLRERLRGIRVIRAFNTEKREHGRIADATHIMAENIIRANVSMGLLTPLATLFLNISALLIIYLGGWRMVHGVSGVSAGDIFAIIQYVTMVMNGVIMASFAIIMYPRAQVAAGRIHQVLGAEGMGDPMAGETAELHGEIELQDVSFSYGGSADAISHVSLHILPGQRISVIGGTGSGKSTLMHLLLGFRAPTQGRILFDGRDAAGLSKHTLRRGISSVLQGAAIYSGTIGENIRMGDPDADDAAVTEAARIAQLADFIASCDGGLSYEIRQAGKNLSGGQKQRLAIARAIIKDAPIYIFDDSFSALDFLTEKNLRTALNRRIAGRTQIVVTQRITSAMSADCIFVMDGGCLVDSGTHNELLARCRIYREIYASQTGGDLQ